MKFDIKYHAKFLIRSYTTNIYPAVRKLGEYLTVSNLQDLLRLYRAFLITFFYQGDV